MEQQNIDWRNIGAMLRRSAMDAHNGELPSFTVAWSFLQDNPECFFDCAEDSDYLNWKQSEMSLIVHAYYACNCCNRRFVSAEYYADEPITR